MGLSVKPLLMVENDNSHNLYTYLLFRHTEEKHNHTKQKRLKGTTQQNTIEQNRIKKRTPCNTTQHHKTKINITIHEQELCEV